MQSSGLKKEASYTDLLTLPDHMTGQILAGELYASPRPATDHAWSAGAVSDEISKPFGRGRGGPGGWWILVEPEIHLGKDILVPDLAGWRRERMPVLLKQNFLTLAPDWVCEVLSPSTARIDRVKKLGVYFREEVRHVWFVDPAAETLEVLRHEAGRWVLALTAGGADMVRAEPFDAIELQLADFWLRQEGAGTPTSDGPSETEATHD